MIFREDFNFETNTGKLILCRMLVDKFMIFMNEFLFLKLFLSVHDDSTNSVCEAPSKKSEYGVFNIFLYILTPNDFIFIHSFHSVIKERTEFNPF